MDPLQLTGRSTTHLVPLGDSSVLIHAEALRAFESMKEAAAAEGIDLSVVSGFRDFDRQAAIWNAKWTGKRPLYDVEGNPVDRASLSEPELVQMILTWSALPGASRHHWGTDLDVIDRAAQPTEYQVQLLPHEFAPGGPFHSLHLWLETRMSRFGFFRPYEHYRGGVSAEPWHLSYAPVAKAALAELTFDTIHACLAESSVEGRELLLNLLPDLYQRYVLNITPPPDLSEFGPRER